MREWAAAVILMSISMRLVAATHTQTHIRKAELYKEQEKTFEAIA